MLTDTHCHIYLPQFKEDISLVLERAADAKVNHIFMPSINLRSLEQMENLSHPEIEFHRMAGLHPTEINEGKNIDDQKLLTCCKKNDIVAVGETGLDYHWSDKFKAEQKKSLNIHCRIAKQTNKPIILHNRSSTEDLLSIISNHQDGSLKGIWHCFNGTAKEGKRAIDLGLHLGIGGVLTFKNAGIEPSVAQLPLDKMVLETDAPYLSPEPNRGRRNEPAFIRFTAEKLADVKNVPVQKVKEKTERTALNLFGINNSNIKKDPAG